MVVVAVSLVFFAALFALGPDKRSGGALLLAAIVLVFIVTYVATWVLGARPTCPACGWGNRDESASAAHESEGELLANDFRRADGWKEATGIGRGEAVRFECLLDRNVRAAVALMSGGRRGIANRVRLAVALKLPDGEYARFQREGERIRAALEAEVGHSVGPIEHDGREVSIETWLDGITPDGCRQLLLQLARVRLVFQRMDVHIHALGGSRKAIATDGGLRCAYCHEAITGSEPDLVACEECKTVLHAECWSELGRCPLLGCAGKTAERAPA